jgi:hypothetical protein
MALNVTATGTIVGFVLTQHSARSLFLLVPVISSTLGLLWLDHHPVIRLLATYVRDEVWCGRHRGRRGSPSAASGLRKSCTSPRFALIYGAGAGACLIAGWPNGRAPVGVWLLAGGGVRLVALFVSHTWR